MNFAYPVLKREGTTAFYGYPALTEFLNGDAGDMTPKTIRLAQLELRDFVTSIQAAEKKSTIFSKLMDKIRRKEV